MPAGPSPSTLDFRGDWGLGVWFTGGYPSKSLHAWSREGPETLALGYRLHSFPPQMVRAERWVTTMASGRPTPSLIQSLKPPPGQARLPTHSLVIKQIVEPGVLVWEISFDSPSRLWRLPAGVRVWSGSVVFPYQSQEPTL